MLRGSYKFAEAAPDKFSFQAGFTPWVLRSGDLCSLWLFKRLLRDPKDREDACEQPAGVCTPGGKLLKMEGSTRTLRK